MTTWTPDQQQAFLTALGSYDQSQLKQYLDYFSSSYTLSGQPVVSDETYDAAFHAYEFKFGPYTAVGASVPVNESVKLPVPMTGIDDVFKADDLEKWLQKYPGPYVVEDKLDGVSALLTIDHLGNVNLYSRGDGREGQKINKLLPYLNIPTLNFGGQALTMYIHGELIVSKADFARFPQYKSGRNAVAGLVNSKDSFNHELAQSLRLVCYALHGPHESFMSPKQQIEWLQSSGFEVPWFQEATSLTFSQCSSFLLQRLGKEAGPAGISPYTIDGIVIYQNTLVDYPESDPDAPPPHPRNVIAFKINETFPTTVKEIYWEASKDRHLIPTVIYDTVGLATANLNRALVDNARNVINLQIGPGAKILVTRSGEVIPRVVTVLQPAPGGPAWPDPAVVGSYHWNSSQVHLVLDADNTQSLANKLEHFLSILEIENFGPGRVEILVKAGLTSTEQLGYLTVEWLQSLEGIGSTIAYQFVQQLREKTTQVPLARIMAASNIFPGLSVKSFRALLQVLPDLIHLPVNDLWVKVQQIHGFGEEKAKLLVNGMPLFHQWLTRHPWITVAGPGSANQTSPAGLQQLLGIDPAEAQRLAGTKYVFSGPRDKDLATAIEDRGGAITTTVSKNTTALLIEDPANTKYHTSKYQKAVQIDVPVFSYQQMRQYIYGT